MPDRTVEVSFTAPGSWEFKPERAKMQGSGNVILTKKPANANWSFSNAEVKDGGDQFQVRPPSGNQLLIFDRFTSYGSWQYQVTVSDANGTYTSPDPEIVNERPG